MFDIDHQLKALRAALKMDEEILSVLSLHDNHEVVRVRVVQEKADIKKLEDWGKKLEDWEKLQKPIRQSEMACMDDPLPVTYPEAKGIKT